jgi:hypothetical protein
VSFNISKNFDLRDLPTGTQTNNNFCADFAFVTENAVEVRRERFNLTVCSETRKYFSRASTASTAFQPSQEFLMSSIVKGQRSFGSSFWGGVLWRFSRPLLQYNTKIYYLSTCSVDGHPHHLHCFGGEATGMQAKMRKVEKSSMQKA